MPQFGRPISDISKTNWTGVSDNTNLFNNIDEEAASNSDYNHSSDNSNDQAEHRLTSLTDPISNSDHIIRWRLAKTASGTVSGTGQGLTATCVVELVENTTVRATSPAKTPTGSWVDHTYTLTSGEADSITDYTNLRLRFVHNCSTGGPPGDRRGAGISWCELEIPSLKIFIKTIQVNQTIHRASTI